MIKKIIILFFSFSLFFSLIRSGGSKSLGFEQKKKEPLPVTLKEKDLPQKYRDWLKLVSYIILPIEKEVFMQLAHDRDRDIFIETFWKQRDPTPATPQNEYKDEHSKRFNYANTFYRRGTTREGWLTDMGRIYIILGPPQSIERFVGVAGVYPAQVWYYYGEKEKRLPTYFAITFYQRGGSGEFRLYSPASDGPSSLLIDTKGVDLTDSRQVYEKIKELAPTLAGVSISMIPGQNPYNFVPSPQANIILADIFNSPKKDISPSYATHFLDYRTLVSTEYLTNYIESSAYTALVKDPILGTNFLHFSISPKKMSIDYYEPNDQYYCNYKLNVSLRRGETIIYQYSKDYPFYFPPVNVENIRGNGIAILDYFPVIEGQYGLTILLQNSVGKEFSIFEKAISVPAESGAPKIVGPVLGYKLQDYRASTSAPFKVMDKQIFIDPTNTFCASDDLAFLFSLDHLLEDLWRNGSVEIYLKGSQGTNPFKKSLTLKLADYPYNKILGISHILSAREFVPDYYEMALSLKNGEGIVLDEAKAPFIISPVEALPRPVTLSKTSPQANDFLYFYSLAFQYDKRGDTKMAEASFAKAFNLKPDYPEGLIDYAGFLLRVKNFDEVLGLIEKLKDYDKFRFGYFLIKGQAQEGKGLYADAIANLLEGNKIYNSDTRLLNSLGFCYYKTSGKTRALEVLQASLRLNPDQPEIKKLVVEIEKSK